MSEQYFATRPTSAHRPGRVRVLLPDLSLSLRTDSGIFSAGRLDPGTRLLLDAAPPPPASGDLLDLGCGYGPLALVLAARAPKARVWAVDINARALDLTKQNAREAGLPGVRARMPDSPDLPSAVDLIWSNPPIRIGKQALHDMLTHWLQRLRPGASAYLVVQRNLGSDSLQRWLTEAGWHTERAAARAGYRLLRAAQADHQPGVAG